MRTYWLPVTVGLVLGGLVHLGSVLAMPRLALEDAFARVERLGPANMMHQIPPPTPFDAVLPRLDPAFAHAVCHYDLSQSPIQLRVPLVPDYMSVSFYSRFGMPYYALNDRSAGQRSIDLLLMTSAQRAALPQDEEITAADRLIIESPSEKGVIFVRAFVRERGVLGAISTRLGESQCEEAE